MRRRGPGWDSLLGSETTVQGGVFARYLDDNPTGTASDTYAIGLTITDDHGGVGAAN